MNVSRYFEFVELRENVYTREILFEKTLPEKDYGISFFEAKLTYNLGDICVDLHRESDGREKFKQTKFDFNKASKVQMQQRIGRHNRHNIKHANYRIKK